MAHFTPLSITDEINSCDCCGKQNLKATVVLETPEGELAWYGRDCAAKAICGIKTKRNADLVVAEAIGRAKMQPLIDVIRDVLDREGPEAAERAGREYASTVSWVYRGATDSGPHIKYWRTSARIHVTWNAASATFHV